MDAVAEAALEAVAVKQGKEELEVLFLAVMRLAVISRKWRVRPESISGSTRAIEFRTLDSHGDGQETGGATGVADVGGHGGPSDE